MRRVYISIAISLFNIFMEYSQKADSTHPNVVFVYADDMGRGVVRVFNYSVL